MDLRVDLLRGIEVVAAVFATTAGLGAGLAIGVAVSSDGIGTTGVFLTAMFLTMAVEGLRQWLPTP